MIFVWAVLGVIAAELFWWSIMWVSVKLFYREKKTSDRLKGITI